MLGWTVNRLPKGSRMDWLALRREDLTASEAGALFGTHKYTTARKLMYDKAYGETEDRSDSEKRRGQIMEPAVAEAITIDTSLRPRRCDHYLRARAGDPLVRMGATLDYDVRTDAAVLLADPKTRAGALAAGWTEGELYLTVECKSVDMGVFEREWANGPPPYHLIQVAQQSLLAGADGGIIACLVENRAKDLFLYPVPRHPAFEAKLVAEAREFWRMFESGEEPPVVALDNQFMATYFPADPAAGEAAQVVNLSEGAEWFELVEEREGLKMGIDRAKHRIDELEARLKDRMREATRAILPGWSITWNADKNGKRSLRIERRTKR